MNTELEKDKETTRQAVCSTDLLCVEPKKKDQTVVRLTTTGWSDSRGVHFKKSLTVLKRKSFGMNIIEEECSAVGAEEGLQNIENLLDVPDGIYEVVACNISRDIESGFVDGWDLRLIPFDA